MLDQFIQEHRTELIERVEGIRTHRSGSPPTEVPGAGIALFVDQLTARLRDASAPTSDIAESAATRGKEMQQNGFTIAQVVQGYGDVCQVVTTLAIERNAPISVEEFRILNRCLDTASAEAVREYEALRDRTVSGRETQRLGFLAHELRNKLNSAMMSFDLLKRGSVGIGGSTSAVLGRSLSGLRELIDRALAEVRLESGVTERERVRVWDFVEQVEIVAAFEAAHKDIKLTVSCAHDDTQFDIDRHLLASAVGNLLQNAIKFTHNGGHVKLLTHVRGDRVLIDVEDECGGLPGTRLEDLFKPFEQQGKDRTGLGLGLAISQRGVLANHGELRVVDRPGRGCTFTVDLPVVHILPTAALARSA
jgi:signal transduction histidine kinase